MRLASLKRGGRDGTLVLVSDDGARVATVTGYATLQTALDDWSGAQSLLAEASASLAAGSGEAVSPDAFAAPLPRAWQWLDGSAYPSHGVLMQQAFNLPPIETKLPLMYQGLSDQFLGPLDDVALPSEDDGIDFEGELGVIVEDVPMGVTPAEALGHIKLLIQINDWSLRTLAPVEMKTGFGFVQAKPACSAAPFAVTPDELGAAWRDGRIEATLHTTLNSERFGAVDSSAEMAFGFHELVAHAARTRRLCAGTIIGSGTVSSRDYAAKGSSCLSERRAIDAIAGRPLTPFMRFGDHVRMEARIGETTPFGIIDQRVVSTI